MVCKWLGTRKVGHAGTLDPLATGVLVACVGPATRLTKFVQKMPKTYIGRFQFGMESTTEDLEGEVTLLAHPPEITQEQIEKCLLQFVGEIQQVPPAFSALWVNGKRAYDLAREGKKVDLKPRTIEIHRLELLSFDYPNFELEIECGSGTYIRSLGRDIGRELKSGAIMTALERTKVGIFHRDNSIEVEQLGAQRIEHFIVPPIKAVRNLRRAVVGEERIQALTNGKWLKVKPDNFIGADVISVVDEKDRLIAVMNRKDEEHFTPTLNFSKYWCQQDALKSGK